MSIYATCWVLKFPRYGDAHTQCEWVEVLGQGVPAHIGTPFPGYGYEDGDHYLNVRKSEPLSGDPLDVFAHFMIQADKQAMAAAGTAAGRHQR